jgi:hypothetical protein
LGGSIGCTSEVGVGSVFTVRLPVEYVEPLAPPNEADPSDPSDAGTD